MTKGTDMTIWNTIATERRRLADELENLTDEQWSAPSQCAGWTVEDVAVHTLLPFEVSTMRFGLTMLKNRGNLDKTALQLTARLRETWGRREAVAGLRTHAENQWTPPGPDGAEVPLAEIVVHGQDIRRALNLPTTVPQETLTLTLQGVKDDARRADYADRIGISLTAEERSSHQA